MHVRAPTSKLIQLSADDESFHLAQLTKTVLRIFLTKNAERRKSAHDEW